MMTMATNLISDDVFGVAIVRNGKRWQASVETKDGQWTPFCDGKTPALAMQSALDRVKGDDSDLDFG